MATTLITFGLLIFSICMYCYNNNQQDLFDDPGLWPIMGFSYYLCFFIDYIYCYIIEKIQIITKKE